LALGKQLQRYGHDVRLLTHETFRKTVKAARLQCYSIGGDPHELMRYVVRNPGFIPGPESVRNGDIGGGLHQMQSLKGYITLCFVPDYSSGQATGFTADAIMSNPPTFAQIHCVRVLRTPSLWSFQ
ncbi:hypothetical protein B0J17DRAFT_563693, partial [Rhizoctonia solani]